jgi:hypothetical protein
MPTQQRKPQPQRPAREPFDGDALDVDHFDPEGWAVFAYQVRPEREQRRSAVVEAFLAGTGPAA